MTSSLLLRATALSLSIVLGACAMNSVASDKADKSDKGTVTLGTRLSSEAEVPPNTSAGVGDADVSLNRQTGLLRWKITYSGLTGEVTAAHFHGPAMPGENAGVVVPFTGSLASPIEGQTQLTPEQVAELLAGKWYINLHTAANPGGEVRGQVSAGM